MISKQTFLESVEEEVRILSHLHTKLGAEHFDYRPSSGQRSIRELMWYLGACVLAVTRGAVLGEWEAYYRKSKEHDHFDIAEFPARMQAQLDAMRELFRDIPEADFEKTIEAPWGTVDTLGAMLLNTALKYLTAYRMQLFLHAKAAGLADLSTHQAWIGRDPVPES